jgi:chitin synthase
MSSAKKQPTHASLARVDFSQISPSPTESEVAQTLRDRFVRDAIYTRVGARVLVSINPGKPVLSSNDGNCAQYVDEYKNTNGEKEALDPHVWQMASRAYMHMRRSGTDQSILLQHVYLFGSDVW